jgi:hypothetical protein
LVFQASPSLSSDGSVVAFISSANLAANNADGNAEIYVANFGGGAVSNIRQVTRTLNGTANTNVFSTGRRLSRNGALIAFESRATDPKSNAVPTAATLGTFVYTIATDTFVEIGTRTPVTDIGRFPMFTDYNAALAPSSLVFASFLNFRPDGTFPSSAAQANEGINTDNSPDIFLTQIPASGSNTFIRLTNMPTFNAGGTRPIASESHKRIAFTVGAEELGGGNGDGSSEVFYLLTPLVNAQGTTTLSFFTGASNMPVTAATPAPSPTPSPTPTPSPSPGAPIGLAPGELSIVRTSTAIIPSDATAGGASETKRSPALPIELNGVSLSVNGAAAGLYFVGNASKQINFVMPIGLGLGLGNVAINVLDNGTSTDTLYRGLVQVVFAQPDIFTTTNDAGGRAIAFNVTNPSIRTPEPFTVTSTDASGATVPTVIELSVTAMRFAAPGEVTITVGTTAISAASILAVRPNPEMPGFDIINFQLPSTLAGAGDVPIQVQEVHGITTVSRPADTAPHITIQ